MTLKSSKVELSVEIFTDNQYVSLQNVSVSCYQYSVFDLKDAADLLIVLLQWVKSNT